MFDHCGGVGHGICGMYKKMAVDGLMTVDAGFTALHALLDDAIDPICNPDLSLRLREGFSGPGERELMKLLRGSILDHAQNLRHAVRSVHIPTVMGGVDEGCAPDASQGLSWLAAAVMEGRCLAISLEMFRPRHSDPYTLEGVVRLRSWSSRVLSETTTALLTMGVTL